jgi:hypothetical protein
MACSKISTSTTFLIYLLSNYILLNNLKRSLTLSHFYCHPFHLIFIPLLGESKNDYFILFSGRRYAMLNVNNRSKFKNYLVITDNKPFFIHDALSRSRPPHVPVLTFLIFVDGFAMESIALCAFAASRSRYQITAHVHTSDEAKKVAESKQSHEKCLNTRSQRINRTRSSQPEHNNCTDRH